MAGARQRECPFILGPFRVLKPLGSGTQGDVYLAEREGELGFRRKMAVKIVVTERDLGKDRAVKSLANEARGLAEVFHPNVVQVFDFSKIDNQYLLVMEFVDGPNLSKLIRYHAGPGRALPVALALRIAQEVTAGLACVHGLLDRKGQPAPMVHRDLKPSNVIVSRYGVVKLVDFGLVKGSQVAFHTMVPNITRGTPSYMSPEQVRGEPLTPASDQFAVGMLLYEMLTGEAMFQDVSEQAVMLRVAEGRPSGDPTRLREICPELIPLLARCLAADPSKRFTRTEELVAGLAKLRQERGEVADLVGMVARLESGQPPVASKPAEPDPIESWPTPPRVSFDDERTAPGHSALPPPRAVPQSAPPSPKAPAPKPAPKPGKPPGSRDPDPFQPASQSDSMQTPEFRYDQRPEVKAPEIGDSTHGFFYGDKQRKEQPGPPSASPPQDLAPPEPPAPPGTPPPATPDPRPSAKLGAATQAFFFNDEQAENLGRKPQVLGPETGGADEAPPPLPSLDSHDEPSTPGATPAWQVDEKAESRLGAHTEAFFFGNQGGSVSPPDRLAPGANDPLPAGEELPTVKNRAVPDPDQEFDPLSSESLLPPVQRGKKRSSFRQSMSRDVSFKIQRPIRSGSVPAPLDSMDSSGDEPSADPDGGAVPEGGRKKKKLAPWERDD